MGQYYPGAAHVIATTGVPTNYEAAFPGEHQKRAEIPEAAVVLSIGGRDPKWKYLVVDNSTANNKALPYKVAVG